MWLYYVTTGDIIENSLTFEIKACDWTIPAVSDLRMGGLVSGLLHPIPRVFTYFSCWVSASKRETDGVVMFQRFTWFQNTHITLSFNIHTLAITILDSPYKTSSSQQTVYRANADQANLVSIHSGPNRISDKKNNPKNVYRFLFLGLLNKYVKLNSVIIYHWRAQNVVAFSSVNYASFINNLKSICCLMRIV